MNDILLIVAWGLALVLAPWFGLMACIVVAAFRRSPGSSDERAGSTPPSFLFVIPAHDEAAVVGITVRSCLAVDYAAERFQVLVIADNCTDETAAVAAAAGATVLVRHDLSRKSKGFALEDFFRGLPTNQAIRPTDAFVLVDADTSVAPDLLHAFNRSLDRGDDFVQGYYTVRNADASWRTRLLTYAFSLANGVWLAGLDRLGLGVGLKGNGMCFRAEALRRFPWQAHGLVEDMEFAWKLRIAGERVRFQPRARVYGEMVSRGDAGAASQRRRWESGRQALRASFRRDLGQASGLSRAARLGYRIDLEFPPLSRLLVGLTLASAVCGTAVYLAPAEWHRAAPALVIAGYWITLVAYAVSPIWVVDLPPRYLMDLIRLPQYMLWKLAVGMLRAPQKWVRTPRETTTTRPSA